MCNLSDCGYPNPPNANKYIPMDFSTMNHFYFWENVMHTLIISIKEKSIKRTKKLHKSSRTHAHTQTGFFLHILYSNFVPGATGCLLYLSYGLCIRLFVCIWSRQQRPGTDDWNEGGIAVTELTAAEVIKLRRRWRMKRERELYENNGRQQIS